ncbi:MAG: Flp pilus assembly complex ATPase component TadA [Planctomycetaceae bacterium]|jgi:pilus assembly protein CpaF|nr:Flp pilus assembly complex ATPase component TadA [Planctomycetaceae bacterium]
MKTKEIYTQSIRYFLAPVLPLLDDADISEVQINGIENIYYEKHGQLHRSEYRFPSEHLLRSAATNIAEYSNRRVGGKNHSVDARLPDGSRVHIIVPPSSRIGICISIRKFKKSTFNIESLIQWGSLSPMAAEFLRIAILLHKNIIISGGTGTGKTSLLNALSSTISEHERVIVIEDSSELQLQQPHVIYLEAQPPQPDGTGQVTIRDLFVDSLRMRPDRIVIGEVRRGEALDLIQSMISGHSGSMTTVHANTPRDAAIRLETLSLMSDVSLPVYVARAQVASAIHLVIQIERFADGSRKVTYITEGLGLDEKNNYQFQNIFHFVHQGWESGGKIKGTLAATGYQPSFTSEPYFFGLDDKIVETKDIFQKET